MIEVKITNVNKEANFISYTQKDGNSHVREVVYPAQIKFAKIGKSEIVVNDDGKVSFIKNLEQTQKYEKIYTINNSSSTMEIVENSTLQNISEIYNSINSDKNRKCSASTLFRLDNGNYDAALYVTTFNEK